VRNPINKYASESGFTILQLAITIAILGIISTLAVLRIRSARDSLALQNSVRQLAANIEKARLDAVRRHDTSSIVFTTNKSYNVRMDFDGTGNPYTKTYNLLGDIEIPSGSPLPSISFNWRGRTSACTNTFAFQNSSGGLQSWVDVSDAGDVTVNSDVDVLPTVSFGTVSTTAGISTTMPTTTCCSTRELAFPSPFGKRTSMARNRSSKYHDGTASRDFSVIPTCSGLAIYL